MKNTQNIFVLLGKSSTGKDTLLNSIIEDTSLNNIVSITTRPKRPNEIDGKDYHFTDRNSFKKLIKNEELIEYRTYNTLIDNKPDVWYYGITKDDITGDSIVILDIIGLEGFLQYYRREDVKITSIYIHTPDKVRRKRAQKRAGFDIHEWNRRAADDDKVFSNVQDIVDYTVFNIDLNIALNEIKEIINETQNS